MAATTARRHAPGAGERTARRIARQRQLRDQPAAEPTTSSSPAKPKPTKPKPAKSSSTSSAKRTAKRARKVVRSAPARSIRKAARQLTTPTATAVSSAGGALALSLVVVALYLVLSNTAPLGGFVGGAGKALEWLVRPDRSIPYGPGK